VVRGAVLATRGDGAAGMPRKMSGGGGDAGALGEITNHGAAAAAHAKGAMPFADGAGSRVFAGMVFAFAGRFSAAQAALKGLIEGGGGSCAASVTLKVTHVISTRAAVEDEKRSAAIATAIGRGLPLLHEDFLARCVDEVRHPPPPPPPPRRAGRACSAKTSARACACM
jgi:hypothetical protein